MSQKRGVFLVLLVLIPLAMAHTDAAEDSSVILKQQALAVLGIAGLIITIMTILSVVLDHHKTEKAKWLLFLGILLPALFATIFIAATTLYVNIISTTNGPVHWHADFEIWHCDQQLDIIDPTGLTNRKGTSTFHEHGDNRIHLEGVPINLKEYTLHHFFEVIGGELTEQMLRVWTDKGMVTINNGESCRGQPGMLQVFLYTSELNQGQWQLQQQKLEYPASYLLHPHTQVPPGDCLIIEFAEEKQQTEHLCGSYRRALEEGELHGR